MLLATLPLGPRCSVVLCPVLLCRKLNQGALRWALGVGTSPQAISEGRGQGTDVLLTNTSNCDWHTPSPRWPGSAAKAKD